MMPAVYSANTRRGGSMATLMCVLGVLQVHILTTAFDGSLTFWDIHQPDPVKVVAGAHTGAATCVACSRDLIVTGGVDAAVKLWSLSSRGMLAEYRVHCEPVTCISFSADGSSLVSGGTNGDARIWTVQ